MARLSVFGLGYVGSVTAACLAEAGHHVVGVDVNPAKLAAVERGEAPVTEPGLEEALRSAVADGRLSPGTDVAQVIAATDASLICVGTPSNRNGSLALDAVVRVAEEIGRSLRQKSSFHTVIMRSTVLPGTARDTVVPAIEAASGRKAGEGFGYVSNPEFLREGSAMADFRQPELTVLGGWDARSIAVAREIYAGLEAPVVELSVEAAEMVKYANNAFHALKVAFANEIGQLARSHGVDGRQVMDVLCQDRKLNISPAYLRPGFAFGGSCLPKDTRALVYRSRQLDIDAPLLASILPSNDAQIRRAVEAVEQTGAKQIGVLGLAFKSGTDDVRESPMVSVIETLIGRGYDVSVFDEVIQLDRLTGANKAFLETEIPHIASLMVDTLDQAVARSDVIVVGTSSPSFADVGSLLDDSQIVIDLVGGVVPSPELGDRYVGSGW